MQAKGVKIMLILYLLGKRLDKKDDHAFLNYWELKFLPRLRYYMFGALIYYALALGIILEVLLWGNDSILFGLLMLVLASITYGILLLRSAIRFFAKYNGRYIIVKSGGSRDTFDKSNVVN